MLPPPEPIAEKKATTPKITTKYLEILDYHSITVLF